MGSWNASIHEAITDIDSAVVADNDLSPREKAYFHKITRTMKLIMMEIAEIEREVSI